MQEEKSVDMKTGGGNGSAIAATGMLVSFRNVSYTVKNSRNKKEDIKVSGRHHHPLWTPLLLGLCSVTPKTSVSRASLPQLLDNVLGYLRPGELVSLVSGGLGWAVVL